MTSRDIRPQWLRQRNTYERKRVLGAIVLIWLLIGLIAAAQTNYLDHPMMTCPSIGTIAVNIVAGPLNYLGVNPHIADCHLPQPSQ
ncbi:MULTISPECIES: hypothetical protein [unclassified Nocardia]|uniref:hypothetical protein n=1 Tax=unclassified Nocardia TaxID=2637762 RepID=UPI001CE40B04|nr:MULTISPECIES: hypothetical protein [unclassified Nocardia]